MRAPGPRRSSTIRCARAPPSTRCRSSIARREAAAAIRSAAGARDSQRPLLAAGRHLHDRRPVQRSRAGSRAAAVAAGRPQRSAAATWMLQPQPGEPWQTTLWLPVDASFVGLRGPVELERAIDVDHDHADGGRRCRRSAARAGRARGRRRIRPRRCSFTTSSCIRKPQGFWTIGATRRRRSPSRFRRARPRRWCCACIRARAQSRHLQHVRLAAQLRAGARPSGRGRAADVCRAAWCR